MGNFKKQLLQEVYEEAYVSAQQIFIEAEKQFKEAQDYISQTDSFGRKHFQKAYTAPPTYNNAEDYYNIAKHKLNSGDYKNLLEVSELAQKVISLSEIIRNEAAKCRNAYEKELEEKVKGDRGLLGGCLFTICGGFLGAIIGAAIVPPLGIIGLFVGAFAGFMLSDQIFFSDIWR